MKKNTEVFHNRFLLKSLLGCGGFAEVWLAKDTKTDLDVALKIFTSAARLGNDGLDVSAREFTLVFNANHENLLKPLYFDCFDGKPYLVLPYCKNGSIVNRVGSFDERQAWQLIRDVASGLAYLHSMNPPVIHQDVKPDNIMVGDDGHFMITDFGISTHIKSALRQSLNPASHNSGNPTYMAPERFRNNNSPAFANDIYSLGVTVFEMVSGDTPFGQVGGLIQNQDDEIPELEGNFSPQLKKVIAQCLNYNAEDRPSAQLLVQFADNALAGRPIDYNGESFFKSHKMGILALLFVLLVGGISWLLFPKPPIEPTNPKASFDRALQLMNSTDKDSFFLGYYQMDSLSGLKYIPAMNEMAVTHGWCCDEEALKRKDMLGIVYDSLNIKTLYLPLNLDDNVKATSLMAEILTMNDSSFARVNANMAYLLACYCAYADVRFLPSVDRSMDDYLNVAKDWAIISGDRILLDGINDAINNLNKIKK